jgi:APA family basic amino acid/polyamine antiporter
MTAKVAGAPTETPIAGAGLFLRRSSGLVRAFSIFDGFLYGVYADSIVVAAALTYAVCWPWADANIPLGIVMCCIAFIPCFVVYAMLTSLMPRAGGDYVWQSRALGGFWGYILVFTPLLFGPWFYMASNVAPGATMVFAPTFVTLSNLLHLPALTTFATWLTSKVGTWWFYVFYCSFAALVLGLGMKFYAKIQRWCFYVGMVGLVTWAIMLILTTNEQFMASFNSFMANTLNWGGGQAYQQVLQMAQTNGFKAVPLSHTSVGSSFLIGPALAYTFMYIAWTGTLVGEIGGVNQFKNSLKMFVGGNLFAMVVCAGFLWLLISKISNEFFTSSNYLWMSGNTGDMPVAPYYGIFLMSLSKSPWVWLWIAIGLNAWFWIWPTNNMVASTRIMFAMSYDRMLPGIVARVSRRWGAPIVAITICYIGCLVMGWLYFFTGFSQLTLDMPLMTSIAFCASTLVGTLFPYLKSTRQIYADSPISKYKVAGIPLITVMGALGLLYFAIMFFLYITDGRYGTNNPLSAAYIFGALIISAVIYFAYRFYRKQQGINTDMTYREIPTE